MDREQHLLGRLAGEASEISQIALKAQEFGLEEVYEEAGKSNRLRIHDEIVDLLSVVYMLNEEHGFGLEMNEKIINDAMKKISKVNKWRSYAQKLGKVDVD